jgi:hypothetical protein
MTDDELTKRLDRIERQQLISIALGVIVAIGLVANLMFSVPPVLVTSPNVSTNNQSVYIVGDGFRIIEPTSEDNLSTN